MQRTGFFFTDPFHFTLSDSPYSFWEMVFLSQPTCSCHRGTRLKTAQLRIERSGIINVGLLREAHSPFQIVIMDETKIRSRSLNEMRTKINKHRVSKHQKWAIAITVMTSKTTQPTRFIAACPDKLLIVPDIRPRPASWLIIILTLVNFCQI